MAIIHLSKRMLLSPLLRRMDPAANRAGLTTGQQILLAHCNEADTDLLTGYLGGIYNLFAAINESHLFDILQDQAIHLIIIDSGLSNTRDGSTLSTRLKSSPHFAHIPIILVVAGNDPAARIGSLECGADAWVERPLSREYLRAQARNLIANRTRLQHYLSQPIQACLPARACTGDEAFLNRLSGYIADHLPDANLHVDELARLMNMSRPTLYRRIKCISDLTPGELINNVRLKRAAELLSAGDHKIFEIAKMVGFNSRSNFGKAFLKRFRVLPREYQQMTKNA